MTIPLPATLPGAVQPPRARLVRAVPVAAPAPITASGASPAELWRRYRRARSSRTGTSARANALRNALVEQYQPLVHECIRRFERRLPRNVDRADLGTAANVGLIAAIEAFDRSRGVPFEVYCERRVRGALLDELRNQDWLPRAWRARLEEQRRTVERLCSDLGREPDDEEVALALGLAVDAYRQDFGPGILVAPAARSRGEEGRAGGAGLEGLPDPDRDGPGDRMTRQELLRLVARKLSAQENRLVYHKYWEEYSMREIGELLGLSESRVCKIHARILGRLRDKLGAESAG